MFSEILRSKFFARIGAIALVLLLIFLGRELKKRYDISREIQSLQNEILSLEVKNQQTQELINYFKTREFQERQARSLLNLQKPGEFAAVLPFQDTAASADEGLNESQSSNLKKWWEYFFNASR